MNPMKFLKSRKAFTLIELIIVVSIVAILMTIIIPASQRVFNNSRKVKARAYMKQIAEAYCRYYHDNGFIPTASTSVALAQKFAEGGELNNSNLFVFPGDSQAAAVVRENIWPNVDGSPWETGKKLSVVLVGNIVTEVNQSTTPVVYSRGLSGAGWGNDGVWGTEGGFIGFLDGQVRWYKTITGQLSGATGTAADIAAAVSPSGGTILTNVST